MSIDIKSKLAGMKKTWLNNRTEAEKGFNGNTVPAGIYLFKIAESNVGSTSSGKLSWFIKSVVLEGDCKDQTVLTMLNLEHDVGQQIICQFINAMGYEVPEDISEVPTIADEFQKAGICFRGKLTYNKDGYAGMRVIEVIDNEGTAESTPEPEVEAEVIPEPEPEPEAEVDPLQAELLAFCAANGIEDVTDDSTVDEIKAMLGEYSMKEEELDKEEIELLTRAGMGDMIVKKSPLKPAAVRKKK